MQYVPNHFRFLYIALKSMQNAQALNHTNGLTKYFCKYISKFDEGNYTVLMQDIHTGELVLGKVHLHNTKIVRSKINKDKAYSKERLKNHSRGREMPMLEIRQVMFGDEEVFTNLEFVQICTLPFELRPTNSVKLDSKGQVIGDINNNYMNKEEILVPDTNQFQHQNQPDAFFVVTNIRKNQEYEKISFA